MSIPSSVWVSGYGQRLVPRVPYEVALAGDSAMVVFVHHSDEDAKIVRVVIETSATSEDDANPRVAHGENVAGLGDVLSFVESDPFEPRWSIVHRRMKMAFPAGTTFWSTPAGSGWDIEVTRNSFEADGEELDGGELVTVSGPFSEEKTPDVHRMDATTMTIVDEGQVSGAEGLVGWVAIAYENCGSPWLQQRYRCPLGNGQNAVVTGQAPKRTAEKLWPAAEILARSVRARERPE